MAEHPPSPLAQPKEPESLVPISTPLPAAMSGLTGTSPPELDAPAIFHGFDEFLDEDSNSLDDLLYKTLHNKPPLEEGSSARKTGTADSAINPTTSSITVAVGHQIKKRTHEDEDCKMKVAKRKTETGPLEIRAQLIQADPGARKRPVCATKRKVDLSDRNAFVQQQSGATPLCNAMSPIPPAPPRKDVITKAATTAASRPSMKTTPTHNLASSLKFPATSKPTTIQPFASTKRSPATTITHSTHSIPAPKCSSIVEYVGRVPKLEYRELEPDADEDDKSKKQPKPKVPRKLAKAVGLRVTKKKSDDVDGPVPLSAVAQRLTPAQIAARKAAKVKVGKVKVENEDSSLRRF